MPLAAQTPRASPEEPSLVAVTAAPSLHLPPTLSSPPCTLKVTTCDASWGRSLFLTQHENDVY
eukprot:m.143021 g.143021  ORF g.143021 m.143021 type:complete len:63 (-) comp52633_c2_seq1:141-329(-)